MPLRIKSSIPIFNVAMRMFVLGGAFAKNKRWRVSLLKVTLLNAAKETREPAAAAMPDRGRYSWCSNSLMLLPSHFPGGSLNFKTKTLYLDMGNKLLIP